MDRTYDPYADADPQRDLLLKVLRAGIDSADAMQVLAGHLPDRPRGRCIVVGAGKASARMAQAVEEAWPDVDLSGLIVTRYGHGAPTARIEIMEAAHPVPDRNSQRAAKRMLALARGAGPDDLVLSLISGGGSALMVSPKPPLTLADKTAVNQALLASGETIATMNAVRRRLSLVKGGRLAIAAQPARLVTLAISDVPGDDPQSIASGPTVPDLTAAMDLSHLVDRLGSALPEAARALLRAPAKEQAGFETDFRLIATPMKSLEAAAEVAVAAGITPVILGDAIEGEARETGRVMAGIARSVAAHGTPARRPALLLSGGETTVTIGRDAPGRGGRNTEFLLALAIALDGHDGIHAMAADTDGIDGTEDAAGAVVTPDTLACARAAGMNPTDFLDRHDSNTFFDRLGDLVRTGPTLTNVNDLRAILVL